MMNYPNVINYPKLMRLKRGNMVVLFADEMTGMVLRGGHHSSIGAYSKDWDITQFTPYNGILELSNEED